MKHWLIGIALMICPAMAAAEEARPLADDPAIEVQVKRLSRELRCLVCQNQTLADSSAPLAEDLRREIRELAAKGMTDQQITDYLVDRYGDFVRYRPPMKTSTVLLWIGPFALLLVGAVGLVLMLHQRQKAQGDAPLTSDEASKVDEFLNKEA